MRAGELKKRITFMVKSDSSTAEGFPVEQGNTPGPSCWAGVKPTRAKEVFAGNVEREIEEVLFTIRYRKDLEESMMISYNGGSYEIQSIIDVNEGHFKMEILAKKVK